MKHIHLYSIIVLLLSSPAFAQKTTYLSKCGNQQETIVWQEEKANGNNYLYVTQENEQHEYVMNKSFQTEKWKVTNIQLKTDLTIELRNNIYSITGKFKGKSITKTIKSNGRCVKMHTFFSYLFYSTKFDSIFRYCSYSVIADDSA